MITSSQDEGQLKICPLAITNNAQTSLKVFLSAVSDEFQEYREELRRDITRHNVEVKIQEDFKDLGGDTLDKLDVYIAHCDAVIHLVGKMTGSDPGDLALRELRKKYPDLAEKLPSLGEALEKGISVSYTQWEAWLALYHGKLLFIARAADSAERGPKYTPTSISCDAQSAHLARLQLVQRYPGCTFINRADLAKSIAYTAILDLLAQARADQISKSSGFRQEPSRQQAVFLQKLSDSEIEERIDRLRKARYLIGVRLVEETKMLASQVETETAELSMGSREVRARALGWCARFLSQDDPKRARELVKKANALAICEEANLAEAFVLSTSNKNEALAVLSQISSQAARSAALRIVTNREGAQKAIEWTGNCELTVDDFDCEGKFTLLMNFLAVGNWADALNVSQRISEDDLQKFPVLYHAVAMAYLVQAVPEELRASILLQVPFEAAQFPLSAGPEALEFRRIAAVMFEKMSAAAQSLGAFRASNPESDYALWLQLRDPRDHQRGMELLRASMRDHDSSLRRVHLALQFGLKLDVCAIEKEIDRRVALSGKGSADEAYARLALAFAKEGPKAAADYIAAHRDLLWEHLNRGAVQAIEIELLIRAQEIAAAEGRLADALGEGFEPRQACHLRRLIAEFKGADAVSEARRLFEETKDVRDLAHLVDVLESKKAWIDLCPWAEMLYERTGSLEDATRLARALNESEQHEKLYKFLGENAGLITQSIDLKTLWAWVLYREGQFSEAWVVLNELIKDHNKPTHRILRVRLAIAEGKWDKLVEFSTDEWNQREQRTAFELLSAGQLGQAVGAPHAKELVQAAVQKGADDPNILAAAYFHASQAGWEQSPEISHLYGN